MNSSQIALNRHLNPKKTTKKRLKSERWYAGFLYCGNSKQLLEQISKIVQEQQLSETVPLIRLEKKAKGQFYFFLAVQSNNLGQFPQQLKATLLKLQCFNSPVNKSQNCFTYEQIKPMVGVAHDVTDYTNPIPYYIPKRALTDNPFDTTSQLTEEDTRCNPNWTHLIDWLSAKGNGTYISFQNICQIFEIEQPSHVIRNLKLLGYLDTSANGQKWVINPPFLVPLHLNSDNLEFYLCGQQNEHIRKNLAQYGEIIQQSQLGYDAPPCFKIKFHDRQTYQEIDQIGGIKIQKPGNIAQRIAEQLPNIQEWQNNLPIVGGIVPSQKFWKFYQSRKFIDCHLPKQTGFYELRSESDQPYPDKTLFYDAQKEVLQQGDWYGLRFLALHHESDSDYQLQECCYNTQNAQLAVLYDERWPQVYERALVLASGQLPTQKTIHSTRWLVYSNITPDLAYWLTELLSLTCRGF